MYRHNNNNNNRRGRGRGRGPQGGGVRNLNFTTSQSFSFRGYKPHQTPIKTVTSTYARTGFVRIRDSMIKHASTNGISDLFSPNPYLYTGEFNYDLHVSKYTKPNRPKRVSFMGLNADGDFSKALLKHTRAMDEWAQNVKREEYEFKMKIKKELLARLTKLVEIFEKELSSIGLPNLVSEVKKVFLEEEDERFIFALCFAILTQAGLKIFPKNDDIMRQDAMNDLNTYMCTNLKFSSHEILQYIKRLAEASYLAGNPETGPLHVIRCWLRALPESNLPITAIQLFKNQVHKQIELFQKLGGDEREISTQLNLIITDTIGTNALDELKSLILNNENPYLKEQLGIYHGEDDKEDDFTEIKIDMDKFKPNVTTNNTSTSLEVTDDLESPEGMRKFNELKYKTLWDDSILKKYFPSWHKTSGFLKFLHTLVDIQYKNAKSDVVNLNQASSKDDLFKKVEDKFQPLLSLLDPKQLTNVTGRSESKSGHCRKLLITFQGTIFLNYNNSFDEFLNYIGLLTDDDIDGSDVYLQFEPVDEDIGFKSPGTTSPVKSNESQIQELLKVNQEMIGEMTKLQAKMKDMQISFDHEKQSVATENVESVKSYLSYSNLCTMFDGIRQQLIQENDKEYMEWLRERKEKSLTRDEKNTKALNAFMKGNNIKDGVCFKCYQNQHDLVDNDGNAVVSHNRATSCPYEKRSLDQADKKKPLKLNPKAAGNVNNAAKADKEEEKEETQVNVNKDAAYAASTTSGVTSNKTKFVVVKTGSTIQKYDFSNLNGAEIQVEFDEHEDVVSKVNPDGSTTYYLKPNSNISNVLNNVSKASIVDEALDTKIIKFLLDSGANLHVLPCNEEEALKLGAYNVRNCDIYIRVASGKFFRITKTVDFFVLGLNDNGDAVPILLKEVYLLPGAAHFILSIPLLCKSLSNDVNMEYRVNAFSESILFLDKEGNYIENASLQVTHDPSTRLSFIHCASFTEKGNLRIDGKAPNIIVPRSVNLTQQINNGSVQVEKEPSLKDKDAHAKWSLKWYGAENTTSRRTSKRNVNFDVSTTPAESVVPEMEH